MIYHYRSVKSVQELSLALPSELLRKRTEKLLRKLSSGGTRILKQVRPAAGPNVVW